MEDWVSFCCTLRTSEHPRHLVSASPRTSLSGVLILDSMDSTLQGSPLQIVAWFSPMCVGGIIIAAAGGFVLHLLSGTILMLIAGVSWIIAPLLFAIMPANPPYWAFVFPAMITGTIGIDISFNITNIFITTGLPKRQQGLAGAM